MHVLNFVILFLLSLYIADVTGSTYFLGEQGKSCYETCHAQHLNCNPHVVTNNSLAPFTALGIACTPDTQAWWAEDQPSYVVNPENPNYKRCLGYNSVPGGVMCGAVHPDVRRLCACDDPNLNSKVSAFGTGLSNGHVTTTEQIIFDWILPDGVSNGVMTHFWATGPAGVIEQTLIRYYVDEETTAAIQFFPPLACGSALVETSAPWGTKWFGKGAKDGSWFLNFRIPFQKTIRITVQGTKIADSGGFYIIVRGAPQIPIDIGGVLVPPKAKLLLQRFEQLAKPMEWVPVADVPTGSGLFFMHTLSVISDNLNFLEGCYHQYSPYNQPFPGTVLSTGTEDYFDSGWYFNAGGFHLPVSGMTHLETSSSMAYVSAYRFHETDPLAFDNGFLLHWRNGDLVDPAGRKCYMQTGGSPAGNPGPSNVTSYGWVYVWD